VKAALALLAAALIAVPAVGAYRNPTPGRAVVLQIPGMHRAKVRRNVVYRSSPRLRLDVYRPRTARGRLPAVLLGGPAGSRKTSPQKIGWAQLIAASGMASVPFDFRSDGDVAAAIAYVRAHARRLGIDGRRLCTLWFSTAPRLSELTSILRCNVVYYAPLDPALKYPPMLIVKAGRDDPGINDSIDRFETAAQNQHADVRVVTNATARHGFDLGPRKARTRSIMRETLRFLRARLARPLRVPDVCATPAERAVALRFFTTDDRPLVGVQLGSGPVGIVLAHGSQSSLCEWIGYARELAAAGYRVLPYDAGPEFNGVGLDAEAATEALRRAGAQKVVVMGSSLGALAVLVAGSTLPVQPDAVVSLSAPASVGFLRGLEAVARLHAPVLFMAAQDDQPFSDDARSLYAAAASTDKQLRVVPGSAHGSGLLEDPSLKATVWSFIAAHTR
jgi:dienelactone hydrolase